MKTSLQLKMGQQLTMTPQLQQAIRLLQLSTLDLQQEIQEALDSNPMLESEEFDESGPESSDNNANASEEQKTEHTASEQDTSGSSDIDYDDGPSQESLDEQWSKDKLPDDLPGRHLPSQCWYIL